MVPEPGTNGTNNQPDSPITDSNRFTSKPEILLVQVFSNLWMGSWLHNFQIGWIFSLITLIIVIGCVIHSWKYLDPETIQKLPHDNNQQHKQAAPTTASSSKQLHVKSNGYIADDSFDTIGHENSCYITDTDM